MLNNKKAKHIHQLVGKWPKFSLLHKTYANALGNSKLINKYVRISYLSKYSKYVDGLPINISQFYIHRFKYTDLNGKGLISVV